MLSFDISQSKACELVTKLKPLTVKDLRLAAKNEIIQEKCLNSLLI
jgi:hypothetical protein